jgi:predicted Na+-dependent transporter
MAGTVMSVVPTMLAPSNVKVPVAVAFIQTLPNESDDAIALTMVL